MPNRLIIPTAEPFFYPGNHIGCLLIHGFTGTPKEMHPLGLALSQAGFTTLGIRLAGHATNPADMVRTTWHDWLASVEDGMNLLKNCTDQIFLGGLSMGGILTMVAASRYSFSGAVILSTPHQLPSDPRLKFLKWVTPLVPEIEKGPPDWRNLDNLTQHVSYPRYPSASIFQLGSLMAHMRESLPQVTTPVLMMQSRVDTTPSPDSMDYIYNHILSTDKKMVWLENSGHVITREPEREKVFQESIDFIKRVSNTR